MSLYFTIPIGFEYDAGDWIDLDFEEQLRGGVTYSLSSSPSESELAITFKQGISPFKRRLQQMKVPDTAFITQYGNDYDFYLNESRSSVFIAGGIGIAPFRSMIKFAYDNELKSDIHLIYLNKGDKFIFSEELDKWKTKLPNFRVTYINSTELSRKKREKQLLAAIGTSAQRLFIAGPEGMVESTEHLLIDSGIEAKNIRIDSFGGY